MNKYRNKIFIDYWSKAILGRTFIVKLIPRKIRRLKRADTDSVKIISESDRQPFFKKEMKVFGIFD
jgi:hypothetical protein